MSFKNPTEPPKNIEDANIVVFYRDRNKVPLWLDDKEYVSKFIKEITFVEKSPCFCYHTRSFKLIQDNLILATVEYCNHCLNVITQTYEKCPTCNHLETKTLTSWYEMPPKLYELILEVLGEAKVVDTKAEEAIEAYKKKILAGKES